MTDAPASASRAVAPFAFLGSDHPMASRIARLRAAIAERAPDVPGATVHADLTLRPDGDDRLVLHRAYWSLQAAGPDGFRATTLSYHATRDRATWLEFPEDPELPDIGAHGSDPRIAGSCATCPCGGARSCRRSSGGRRRR